MTPDEMLIAEARSGMHGYTEPELRFIARRLADRLEQLSVDVRPEKEG